ncbi:hypothetical protein N7454_010768 [Penicillium verhagenii]|nr:hypothetical protein N7454_010768 [Penicillium verhagenii]
MCVKLIVGFFRSWDGITMTCDSVTIFEQHAQSTDGWSKTAYWCLPGGHPTALYREYDTITTITSTATSTSTSTTPIQTSSTATLPTNTSTSTSASGGSSSKAGPIAGGVVGGVAGVALIAGALWYFFKRRGATKEQGGMSEFGSEFVTVPQR